MSTLHQPASGNYKRTQSMSMAKAMFMKKRTIGCRLNETGE